MKNLFFIILISLISFNCSKNNDNLNSGNNNNYSIPTVITTPAISITSTGAVCGGKITDDGGTDILSEGICWSESGTPDISSTHSNDGNSEGPFTSNMTGLSPNTTYYVRAYATNSAGIAYGNQITILTAPPLTTKVYVTGADTGPSISLGEYWIDGTATFLTPGAWSQTADIFIDTTDIYIAGVSLVGAYPTASIWKNGILTLLGSANTFSNARGVKVVGQDVYVCGEEKAGNYIAKVWKNGIATPLNTAAVSAEAHSIFVSGNDIYVAGQVDNGVDIIATVWKNGIPTYLTSGSGACANAVFVYGNDLYVAGTDTLVPNIPTAKFWKNAVAVSLPEAGQYSAARSVFVKDNDVYVAGFRSLTPGPILDRATVWKNGSPITVTTGNNPSRAASVFVLGTDIYVAGTEYQDVNNVVATAKMWKNGVGTDLSDGSQNAYAISIKVKED